MSIKGIEKEFQLKQLKMELIQLLINTDDLGLLQKLRNELFGDEAVPSESKVVGYTSEGNPISKKEMDKKLLESLEQIKNGDFEDLEDFEKESENW